MKNKNIFIAIFFIILSFYLPKTIIHIDIVNIIFKKILLLIAIYYYLLYKNINLKLFYKKSLKEIKQSALFINGKILIILSIISLVFPLIIILLLLFDLFIILGFFKSSKKLLFAKIGGLLGIPLSYYFQGSFCCGGIFGYLKDIDRVLNNERYLGNLIIGIVVFAIIGWIIGYLIDKTENKQ